MPKAEAELPPRSGKVEQISEELPSLDVACAARGPIRRPVLRATIAGAVLVLALAAVLLSPVRHALADVSRVRHLLDGFGIWTLPTFGLAAAALTASGVPRLLLCGLASMLFGFWPGLLLMHLASILGYYAVFLFVRWGGREWVLGRWPKLQRFADAAGQQGAMGVILARQLPVHGTLINFCLGLSRVGHRDFLIGTTIGLIPEAIPAALIGAGIVEANPHDMARYFVMAAVAFAVIWIGCGYLVRRARAAARPAMAEVSTYEE